MIAVSRALSLLLLLTLLAAACTGGEDSGEDAADPETEQSDADPADSGGEDEENEEGDGGSVTGAVSIPFAPDAEVDVDTEILQAAQSWIDTESGLSEMLREEIFLAEATQTQDVHHLTYVQQHDEVSVRGAQFIVHVRDTGEVLGASQSLITTLPGEGTSEELTQAEAADIATKAVSGPTAEDPPVFATWLEVGSELRLGWEVLVHVTSPPTDYAVVVDATTGDVLSVDQLATDHDHVRTAKDSPFGHTATGPASPARADRRERTVAQAGSCQAPPAPSACIFVVDPIFASGNPQISPEQANATLVGVPLNNLTEPADGNLVGAYAQIAEPIRDIYADPDNVFGEGGRGGRDITFEAAMTYYWVDYTQSVIQSLGYDYHADDPVDLVPIEPEFPDNAFYLFVEDRIHMGDAPDGVREAEDAQGIIHEYGHALLQSAVPNITSDEGGAFHEAFADLVSVFTTLEFRNGDVACLFHWAERGRCIRRVDTDLVYPTDLRFEVHLDAEIYTGAVWDIFEGVLARDAGLVPSDCQDRSTNPCDAARDEVYGTLLGSLPFLTPALDLTDAAAAFAASDQAFNGGRNADVIADAFAAHGLDTTSSTGVQVMQPEDLMDLDRTDAQVALKIVHQFRGDLQVDVGVVDAGGNVLCELSLKTPDGQDGADNITGRFDLTGTDCEPHLPPSPERVWVLRVVDTLEQDEGTLFQFSVIHNGTRYAASGLPLDIPDADQQGVIAVIGADVPTDAEPMTDTPTTAPATPAPDGALEVDIAISHTYVGDLLVQVGVLEGDTVTCRDDILLPDPQDASDGFDATVDLSACAAQYPPAPDRLWFLRVEDTAAQDVGEVTTFVLRGPDGQVRDAAGQLPLAIPDDSPDAAIVLFDG